jgi:2-polyprenyl-6-methoxyphenol hydroxylase-like FAD-dependent oxidoreductase
MTSTRRTHHDVVVVGARVAGAATAMLLARLGHDVLLLDRSHFPSDTLSTHGLARGAVVQLSRWGLLDDVLAGGAPAVRQVTFRLGEEETQRAIKDSAGVDLLVNPRRYVLDALLVEAARDAGVTVQTGVTARGVQRRAGRVAGVVAADDRGNEIELGARLVVGADGVRSRTAHWFGADVVERRAPGGAVFYAYVGDLDDRGQEFHVGEGAMAGVFPTHDGACVWLCTSVAAAAAVTRAGSDRAAALVDAIGRTSPSLGERLRAASVVAPVRGAARLPNHRRKATGPGWALVGDAGYHRDPITGHGITDAFRDAELLARAADEALREPGRDQPVLARYDHERDALVRDTFDLTVALGAFPPAEEFVELQRRLSKAIDLEATALAAQPPVPNGRAVAA